MYIYSYLIKTNVQNFIWIFVQKYISTLLQSYDVTYHALLHKNNSQQKINTGHYLNIILETYLDTRSIIIEYLLLWFLWKSLNLIEHYICMFNICVNVIWEINALDCAKLPLTYYQLVYMTEDYFHHTPASCFLYWGSKHKIMKHYYSSWIVFEVQFASTNMNM